MKLHTNAHAQAAVIETLRGLMEELRARHERRLPGLRELSARYGVAYVTMSKAVRALCREGVLETVRGRGTYIRPADTRPAHAASPAQSPTPAGSTWTRVRASIERDLLRQVYPPDSPLPPSKELSRAYGVSRRTLRKALSSLAAEGLLLPYGGGYRAANLSVREGHGTIVVVARGATSLNRLSTRAQELFRIVQSECSKLNVRLRIAFYEHDTHGALRTSPQDAALMASPRESSVLGYMVFGRGFEQPALTRTVRQVSRTGLPVSVLDESGDFALPRDGTGHGGTRLFSMSNSARCGVSVGRYLLSLGHRRVAYLSAHHASTWSRNRLSGLRRALGPLTDEGGHVYRMVTETIVLPQRSSALYGTVGDAVRALPVPRHRRFGALAPVLGRALNGLTNRINDAVVREVLRDELDPLLREAIAHRDITAWVAANDAIGIHCLDFLTRRGIAVPRDISVVGFDDSLEAFLYKLTSFSHNYPAVVRAMLAHVLQPRVGPERPTTTLPVEVDGFVNRRDSVGVPRRRA